MWSSTHPGPLWGSKSHKIRHFCFCAYKPVFILELRFLSACLWGSLFLSLILYICKPFLMKSSSFLWPDGFPFHPALRINHIDLKYLAFCTISTPAFWSFLGSLSRPGCFLFLGLHVSSLVHLEYNLLPPKCQFSWNPFSSPNLSRVSELSPMAKVFIITGSRQLNGSKKRSQICLVSQCVSKSHMTIPGKWQIIHK